MGNITLIDELLGLNQHYDGYHGLIDFAASIAASNGMLIPLELLVQARLPASADLQQAELLKSEYRHKSRLLDADRHIVACVCDIEPAADDGRSAPARALAACIAALAPSHVPRLLAFALHAAHGTVLALLGESDPAELVMRVDLDSVPQQVTPLLRALHLQLRGHPGTRLVAVLSDAGSASTTTPMATTRALLIELASAVDLIFILPLLTRPSPAAALTRRSRYGETACLLEELGWSRVAPGLFGQRRQTLPRQRPLPWLNRIMTRLPQADVLGLGPAARSRFNEVRFDNHVALADYSKDLGRGGFGIAHAYSNSPVDQFVDALVIKLASGSVVDVSALAVRCQCASPAFVQACGKTFDVLRATGAVSGKDTQRVTLRAANDAWFPEVQTQLDRLRDAAPVITPLARR